MWNILGDGFGWQYDSLGIKWIYFAPGRRTEERLILWNEAKISPRVQGSRRRSDLDLQSEILEKGLPLMRAQVFQSGDLAKCRES